MSIILEHVSYTYQPQTPYEVPALTDISLEIREGEFIGIIGHTGSGKSTLIQHFNGLLKPNSGTVEVDGLQTTAEPGTLKRIRQKVGLVFQYPEHQLFDETVYQDIAFGPVNLGLDGDQTRERVRRAMEMVRLDFAQYKDLSPFVLSGGEKRRAAIAGVLAMDPRYLILDEPTAGLDPRGRDEIMEQIRDLHRQGMAVVFVTHSMDDVARTAQRLIVVSQGKIVYNDVTGQVFAHHAELERIGLDVPHVMKLMLDLRAKGLKVRADILTVEEARREIARVLRGGDA
ncbi:MAG: energy-coupling factor transporter ATPase [Peptococcaceae bacterium]|jgi:energy-coupling factor transport system ATP-binding protein|nr:energy-coupling factor transporter ATPase [Peptococcaceae bacterium]